MKIHYKCLSIGIVYNNTVYYTPTRQLLDIIYFFYKDARAHRILLGRCKIYILHCKLYGEHRWWAAPPILFP